MERARDLADRAPGRQETRGLEIIRVQLAISGGCGRNGVKLLGLDPDDPARLRGIAKTFRELVRVGDQDESFTGDQRLEGDVVRRRFGIVVVTGGEDDDSRG